MVKKTFWLVKKIIILTGMVIIIGSLLSIFSPLKPRIDEQKTEEKIQELLNQQESFAHQVEQLHQEKKYEEIKNLILELQENNQKLLGFNQVLIDEVWGKEKENLEERQKSFLFDSQLLERIKTCLDFYPQNLEEFDQCQKEIKEISPTERSKQ